MRTLCGLLLLSGGLFAQDQAQPSGKFYGPLGANPQAPKLRLNPPKYAFKVTPMPPTTRCAIPLVEMNIPSGTNFVIGSVTPPTDPLAAGSEARNLLPPCSQR
jgi:hypothetical protein